MTRDPLTSAAIALLLREPFYAHLLTDLGREVSEKTGAALGLVRRDDHFALAVNPRFWEEKRSTPDHRYGALKHELLHLVFRHPLCTRAFANPFLFNTAVDLVVNQYIEPSHLLPGALRLTDFPELNLTAGESTRYYYERLRQVWGGRPSPARAILQALYDQRETLFAGHAAWFVSLSPLETGLLTRQLSTALRRARQRTGEKSVGALPAGVRRALAWLDRTDDARIDWRRALRLFAQRSSRTHLKHTIRRPSKRYGTTPGIALQRQHRLLVAVDTSGSIDPRAFQEFFTEIYRLWRQGAGIRLVTCDAAIQSIEEYRGRPPAWVKGGGGTRYDPVLAYANGLDRFDGLVYFTDGYAPAPEIRCRLPILWVVSTEGIPPEEAAFRMLPGRKVKMGVVG